MSPPQFLLRVQSPEGTKRITVSGEESARTLYEKIHDEFGLDTYDFRVYIDRAQTRELISTARKSLISFGLKHGDMLFIACGSECKIQAPPVGPSSSIQAEKVTAAKETKTDESTAALVDASKSESLVAVQEYPVVKEDDVDLELAKRNGKINRPRDPAHCRHNANSQCVHCFPLDPWDDGYIKKNGIKHMSFNAYLRKLQSGLDKGKFVALENLNCSVKLDCPNHAPWPKGLCSKCTPPAVTLTRQKFRHIDHIMFENAAIVDGFLNYWRTTGNQRMGFLYGYWEPHDTVPLGIRAVVVSIYEPPQDSTKDRVSFYPDPKVGVVDLVAQGLGLRRIGWIFTDLMADDRQKGTVQNLRNLESHLLSAQEAITAAYFQNLHPNPCRFASEGVFGSKFVTVCVSGNEENQIHLDGYQISDQGMGLVKYDCIVPTRDIPQLAFVLESTLQKYVPDVFYRQKDKYGNHITKVARPLPIEYLLLDVPLSTPVEPRYTLTGPKVAAVAGRRPFPVENRLLDRDIQDLAALSRYLDQFQSPRERMEALGDLHVLVFLASCDTLPLHPPETKLADVLPALRAGDFDAVAAWMTGDDWQTVEQLLVAVRSNTPPPGGRAGPQSLHSRFGNRTPPPPPGEGASFFRARSPARDGPRSVASASSIAGALGASSSGVRNRPASAPAPPSPTRSGVLDPSVAAAVAGVGTWTCAHCTFINQAGLESCEVCGLPQNA